MRKWIAGAAVAATIGGAGVGAALLNAPIVATAQSTSTTQAQAEERERTAPPWMTEALKGLVDAGTINQSQADAVSEALVAARPEHKPGGPGHGPRGKNLGVIAGAIGIDEAALRTELRAGKTIAQVAQEHGVDVQKVIDALVADLKTHLDKAVAEGRITQAQADEKLANAPERIGNLVNGTFPPGGPDGPGGRGPGGRGPGGPGGRGPAPSTPPTTTG